MVKNLPAVQVTCVQSLGWEDPLQKGMGFQYSCLENPIDRGAQQATVHWVTMSWTRLKQLCMHACTPWNNDSVGSSEQSLSALSPYSSAWMTGFCHPHYLSAQSSCWVQPTEDSSRLVVLFRNLKILEESLLFTCSVMSNSAAPGTVARQDPLSMGFFRQEYWSGLAFPSPGESSHPGHLHW